MTTEVIGTNDTKNRDLKTVKACENCGRSYHPRNGYQATSRFCSKGCASEARRRKRFHPLGLR